LGNPDFIGKLGFQTQSSSHTPGKKKERGKTYAIQLQISNIAGDVNMKKYDFLLARPTQLEEIQVDDRLFRRLTSFFIYYLNSSSM